MTPKTHRVVLVWIAFACTVVSIFFKSTELVHFYVLLYFITRAWDEIMTKLEEKDKQ